MLRQQMQGQMTAPPGGMPYPGEVTYGPEELPFPGDGMHPYPMDENLHAPEMSCSAVGGSCLAAVGPCCANCSTCGPFSFGAEGVFLHPTFAGNEAYSVANINANNLGPLGNLDGTLFSTPGLSETFDWDTKASIRIWAAVKGCDGFGIRGRFWRLEGDTSETRGLGPGELAFASVVRPNSGVFTPGRAVLLGLPGDSITATHNLDLAVADLELVKDIMFPRAMLTLAAGIRYARNDQTYTVNTNGAGVPLPDLNLGGASNLRHQHRFEGTGPMIAMELRRCLGCSGFSVYVNTRGSAVFGETDVWIGTDANPNSYTATGVDETLLIGETSFGLQYSWHKLWLRAGYEAQYWMNAGNANTTGADMGLVGFHAAAGLGF